MQARTCLLSALVLSVALSTAYQIAPAQKSKRGTPTEANGRGMPLPVHDFLAVLAG